MRSLGTIWLITKETITATLTIKRLYFLFSVHSYLNGIYVPVILILLLPVLKLSWFYNHINTAFLWCTNIIQIKWIFYIILNLLVKNTRLKSRKLKLIISFPARRCFYHKIYLYVTTNTALAWLIKTYTAWHNACSLQYQNLLANGIYR